MNISKPTKEELVKFWREKLKEHGYFDLIPQTDSTIWESDLNFYAVTLEKLAEIVIQHFDILHYIVTTLQDATPQAQISFITFSRHLLDYVNDEKKLQHYLYEEILPRIKKMRSIQEFTRILYKIIDLLRFHQTPINELLNYLNSNNLLNSITIINIPTNESWIDAIILKKRKNLLLIFTVLTEVRREISIIYIDLKNYRAYYKLLHSSPSSYLPYHYVRRCALIIYNFIKGHYSRIKNLAESLSKDPLLVKFVLSYKLPEDVRKAIFNEMMVGKTNG